MAAPRNQITGDYRYRPGARKWFKKQFNRLLRRQAKREPEEAPRKKKFMGYD